ncbi:tRNA (adenosine(37)-N6)-threonylcarbamoyltransferase complex ATPase subunit type 1 TsaE [Pleionea litopenaei]|uniref:tRNA threonylcarbamoyladenosine biosynthesis protein TsaE n=1 Tax=Pleionea litopenaei TaxID=3070815 RepID=A0AA51RWQ7_9GAMM|nr:tRNA (adenosine(37)-N6)-threonylcarbamoyltransferase complex ATPase subunit type 1 TsaE [Pleionea sp. HL-JVS1]WMS88992.1 tRNA (adenosine(37)-N6)-threonylcarbamoyltransferase complex ATPase subunit type 1 TsaE [Pleionea sp. HL-JVS1]
MTTVLLHDETDTLAFGGLLGAELKGRQTLVFLNGDLGAGKTTLVRGVLRGVGFQGSTKSPTYTLVEPYELDGWVVYHFDLYRISDPEELEFIGVDEYLNQPNAASLIEWPERGAGWLPEPELVINLAYLSRGRELTMTGDSELIQHITQRWERRLSSESAEQS